MVRLKIKEVAEMKGVNMAKLHDPHHDVSLYILERIAKALDVSICDLIDEQKDTTK